MRHIQKISSYLLFLFYFLIILTLLIPPLQWGILSFKKDLCLKWIDISIGLDRLINTPEGSIHLNTVQWTPLLKGLGFLSDVVGMLPFLLSLFVFRSLFSHYKKGDVFNVKNALLYRKLGLLYLLDAIITSSLSESLMILAVTLANPPGHRYLSLSFGTPQLSSLFYGILVLIVSWVMLEASKLFDENKLTV